MMVKSYRLKVYANKGKLKELNKLLAFWRDQVNRKIRIFWEFKKVKGSYCPTEYSQGGRLIRDASNKAWQIVKVAKRTKQTKCPEFKGNEIDLNQSSAYIIPDFKTKEYDLWFNIISLNKRNRLKIPAKKTKIFEEACQKGKLRKSFKLIKVNGDSYIQCFVELPEAEKKKDNEVIGVDIGLNNAIVTSDGKFFGEELKDLRIRTKWRSYTGKLSPSKQKLNHYAKLLVSIYPDTDFAVEKLLFKGKRGRSKEFRRRNNNWSYAHLSRKLEELSRLEGFQLFKVNAAFSSRCCPECGFTDKVNRQGYRFKCCQCGFEGNADYIGAVNLAERVAREQSVPLIAGGKVNVH